MLAVGRNSLCHLSGKPIRVVDKLKAQYTTFRTERGVLEEKMNAWLIDSYGDLTELVYRRCSAPVISKPNDVVVSVSAASVNPLDIAMVGSYGSVLFKYWRQVKMCSCEQSIEFPLILGRDFSGTVIGKGYSVRSLDIGDEVWGVVPPHDQGSHAEQVVVDESMVCRKPPNLNSVEAGSMLFACLTAWSALKLAVGSFTSKRVLVIGASGGVGTAAVQLLSAWQCKIVATSAADAVSLLQSIGVHTVFDYNDMESMEQLYGEPRFDVILDCAGLDSVQTAKYLTLLKNKSCSKFITLKSPVLNNLNQNGLLVGMLKSAGQLVYSNVEAAQISLSSFHWGFFYPSRAALIEVTKLATQRKIVPVVEGVFPFKSLPEAYKRVSCGHMRGKVVVQWD